METFIHRIALKILIRIYNLFFGSISVIKTSIFFLQNKTFIRVNMVIYRYLKAGTLLLQRDKREKKCFISIPPGERIGNQNYRVMYNLKRYI